VRVVFIVSPLTSVYSVATGLPVYFKSLESVTRFKSAVEMRPRHATEDVGRQSALGAPVPSTQRV